MKQWQKEGLMKAFEEMLDADKECIVYSIVSVTENKRCDFRVSIKKINELPLFQEFYPGCIQVSKDQ